METIYLENKTVENGVRHNKFYRIIDDGFQVVFEWGPIGCRKPGRKVACNSVNAGVRRNVVREQLRKKSYYEVVSHITDEYRVLPLPEPQIVNQEKVYKKVSEVFELNGEMLRRFD